MNDRMLLACVGGLPALANPRYTEGLEVVKRSLLVFLRLLPLQWNAKLVRASEFAPHTSAFLNPRTKRENVSNTQYSHGVVANRASAARVFNEPTRIVIQGDRMVMTAPVVVPSRIGTYGDVR